jgi:transcriptional regulator with XRE-family HTH domain
MPLAIMLSYFLFVKRIRNYNSYIKPIGGRKMLVLDMREIGNKLLAIRKRMGMTQVEVAEAAGLSSRTYADIERGTVNMRVETILRICDALHITPDEVLTKSECELTAQQEEIFSRLNACSPKDRETALRLLSVYLQSLSE